MDNTSIKPKAEVIISVAGVKDGKVVYFYDILEPEVFAKFLHVPKTERCFFSFHDDSIHGERVSFRERFIGYLRKRMHVHETIPTNGVRRKMLSRQIKELA